MKDAVADRPAKRKSGEAGVKKSSSSAQPARPAEIRSVKEAPAAVKKSRSVVKAAKPVKPANKIKSAEKVVGAVQKNRGGAKLVEPVRPDKVQAKLVSPKGKPNVKSARSPKVGMYWFVCFSHCSYVFFFTSLDSTACLKFQHYFKL